MPRKTRSPGTSGYHHVVVRGNGKQVLFEKTTDYHLYCSILRKFSKETQVAVCAYCLMPNHVHLLVYDPNRQKSLFMQKMGNAYAGYYNDRYEHAGHVFQSRFHSETIETDRSFLNVFRYIMQNPQKAGLAGTCAYSWSSYDDYSLTDTFLELTKLKELLPERSDYDAFLSVPEKHRYLEGETRFQRTQDLQNPVFEELGIQSATELAGWDKGRRDRALVRLKQAGFSVREIARMCGLGRNIVQRATETPVGLLWEQADRRD